MRWIKKKTGPSAQTVETAADLNKATASAKAYTLGYFKSLEVLMIATCSKTT